MADRPYDEEEARHQALARVPCEDAFRWLAEHDGPALLAWISDGSLAPPQLTFAAEHAGCVPGADAVLLPLLDHPKAYVREGAVYGLARVMERILERLDAISRDDPLEDIRTVASEAVEGYGTYSRDRTATTPPSDRS
jgi:hypothetical protein